jgi:endo-1,4-beta-xylanase
VPAHCLEAAGQPAEAEALPVAPLRVLGDRRDLVIGAAVNANTLRHDPEYAIVLAREFNGLTPENAMKWTALEPAPGEFDRSDADALIEFARQHDQQVYGHTLVWHWQVPSWAHDAVTPHQTGAMLREHIHAQVSYFQDDVWAWDVANEVFDDDGSLRDSFWLRRLGPEYIADSFRWAREADPDVALFINDFGIEGINAKSDALYAWVAEALDQGVPIDGIGFQVHWTLAPLPGSFADNMARFAELGLDVAITEMDVRIPTPATEQSLAEQAQIFDQALTACRTVPACRSFTVWGVSDAHSWVPHTFPEQGAATLFDEGYRPKPAYQSLVEALRRS